VTAVDIGILIFLGIGAFQGFKSGLLMQLLGIIAFFVAIIGGFQLMYWGAELLSGFVDGYENVLPFIAFFVVFIGTMVLINLIGKGLKSLLDMTLLGSFDNIAGMIIGIFKWTLILSLLIWVIETFAAFQLERLSGDSTLYPYVASFAPFLLDVFSGVLPAFQDFMDQKPDYPQT